MSANQFPLLEMNKISKKYRIGKDSLVALKDVSFSIQKNESLGIVGESGSGKSTLGRIAINLETPSTGFVQFNNQRLDALTPSAMLLLRRQIQMIFQDPYASLNPRMNIEQIIGEGIDIHKLAKGDTRQEIIIKLLERVNLDSLSLCRYPHEFSGGQRQRIVIARALAVNPSFIVCDEPLSALDACTQQQVMQLLLDLKQQQNITYLFISHDLNAVRMIADTIAVMYLGNIVEKAPTARLFASPAHPYTQALLSAIPIKKNRSRLILTGVPPSPLNPPKGCPFHTRCPKALPICSQIQPPERFTAENHSVSCHLPF